MATEAATSTTLVTPLKQAASGNTRSLTIAALAERHAEVFTVDDNARDDAWSEQVHAMETAILDVEPISLDETLVLVDLIEVGLDTLAADDNVPSVKARRLQQVMCAVRQGLARAGAKSRAVAEWLL